MSVFTSDDPLEKRVQVLEKKVKELERMLGKKPKKEGSEKPASEDEDFCVVS